MIAGIQVIEGFKQVIAAIDKLCLHILDELKSYPLWIDNGSGELAAERDRLVYSLKHFQPVVGLTPQETLACPGAVGGTQETLQLIEAVNTAKDVFKATVHLYLQDYKTTDTAVIRQVLASAGFSGIKLKQVFRHIRTLPFHPRRISFTQVKHNSHRIITHVQAQELLQTLGQGLHIEIQLTKLSVLPAQEKLVLRRDIEACWAANAATFKNELGRSITTKIPTSLPLFYLHVFDKPLPLVAFSRKNQKHKPGPRQDKQLEEIPYLPSINAYRYKKPSQ